jgi:hypothetical protein
MFVKVYPLRFEYASLIQLHFASFNEAHSGFAALSVKERYESDDKVTTLVVSQAPRKAKIESKDQETACQ